MGTWDGVGAVAYLPWVDRHNFDQVITLAISGLSLLVSVYVLWRQRRSEGRAHFTAEWEDSESLVYINHGPGAAKDVRVQLESQVRSVDESIGYVGAFQVMRVTGIIRVLGESPVRTLELSWKDNRRKRQTAPIHLPEPPSSRRRSAPSVRDGLEKTVRDLARDEAKKEITDQVRAVTRGRRRF